MAAIFLPFFYVLSPSPVARLIFPKNIFSANVSVCGRESERERKRKREMVDWNGLKRKSCVCEGDVYMLNAQCPRLCREREHKFSNPNVVAESTLLLLLLLFLLLYLFCPPSRTSPLLCVYMRTKSIYECVSMYWIGKPENFPLEMCVLDSSSTHSFGACRKLFSENIINFISSLNSHSTLTLDSKFFLLFTHFSFCPQTKIDEVFLLCLFEEKRKISSCYNELKHDRSNSRKTK